MSINLLKFGLQYGKKDANIIQSQEIEEKTTSIFPDCRKLKNKINSIRKLVDKLHNSNLNEKIKLKKYEIFKKKLTIGTEALIEKLNLNSPNIDEIDPLCSFEEIQKKCKFTKDFSNIIYTNYKFSTPTPIQSTVISILNNKKNIIASSETGSGKTLSYLIPLIHNAYLNKLKEVDINKALIILPTKELCNQIYKEALIFSNFYTKNKVKVKYISKSMLESIQTNYEKFLENNDIIIATPQRALDILKLEDNMLCNKLLYLILDEADKFFDYGFIETIDDILYLLKEKSNVVKGFFSATLVDEIEEIITTHILVSIKVAIGSNRAPARSIHQKFIYCTSEKGKLIGIRNLFKDGFEPPMLVFVEGIEKLKYVYENLKYDIPKTSYLHSKMSKHEREEIIRKFRCGEIWILICTDLLARGIDFKNVKSVLNYDCPYRPINYIHKIGRTGRAGKSGKSFTFVIDDDISKLRNLSFMLKGLKSNLDCPDWILKLK